MITFQKIRWKNFLSTGNQFTEIDFQKNNTNLIIGTNGAGKSTMLDALTFVLFNKPFRKINKPQLANTTNERDCLVEIEFEINTRQYVVRRGIKPNVFDIIVNGTELHREADDRAMQRVLEDNILKVNYKSFTQIVILGSSTFVPFMQLTSANRREVIEDLLLTDNASDGDEWKGESRPCDRIWQAYQERGGCEERWMFRRVITTLPNGITVHTRGERYLGCEPNPFRNVTEPHLRAALKAKGYL